MIVEAEGGGSPEERGMPGHGGYAGSAAAGCQLEGIELPDASLGNGPVWRLKEACARSAASRSAQGAPTRMQEYLMRMARGQLDQALSCDRTTDMRFELDDGVTVGGHKSVLSLASEGFRAMFESGMIEETEGVVRVPGAKVSALTALLEWVYLGE